MIINFSNTKLRQDPNGTVVSFPINLIENDVTIGQPTQMKSVDVDTTTLTAPQKKVVNDFIALMKSKLPA